MEIISKGMEESTDEYWYAENVGYLVAPTGAAMAALASDLL